jgi:plasmid stabilization system protein ParE
VEWTAAARSDLHAIVAYIARQGRPMTARSVARRIERAAERLKRYPQRCRRVPEQAETAEPMLRESVIPPWRVMFRIDGRRVRVAAVVDSRRSLSEWLPLRLAQLAREERA